MQPRTRLLVGALALTSFAVACGDGTVEPSGSGGLVLQLVLQSSPQPVTGPPAIVSLRGPSTKHRASSPGLTGPTASARWMLSRLAGPSTGKTGVIATPSSPAAEAPPTAAAAFAPPDLDAMTIRYAGPRSGTIQLTNTGSAFEGTITDLPVGQYTLTAVGRGLGEVVFYGEQSGVTVAADRVTQTQVAIASWVPTLDPLAPNPTTAFSIPMTFSAVSLADEYLIEVDAVGDFADPLGTATVTQSNVVLTGLPDIGTYYVRVRAANQAIAASDASPSNAEVVDVIADLLATGDDISTALFLGTGNAADGLYTGLNITPGDEDWFAVDLVRGQVLTAAVYTQSLDPTSELDPVLMIYDGAGNLVAENDDDLVNGTLESFLPIVPITADDTYNIKVIGFDNVVDAGHYELEIMVSTPTFSFDFDVDPDGNAITAGTLVNDVYAVQDVTFTNIGPNIPPASCGVGTDVYANSDGGSQNFVSVCPEGDGATFSEDFEGIVEANFTMPASMVCVDTQPEVLGDVGFLEVFDVNGSAIDRISSPTDLDPSLFWMMCYAHSDIYGARFAGETDLYMFFDNLRVFY